MVLQPNPNLAAYHNESQTHKTSSGGKERGLFKCQPPEKMGDSHLQEPTHYRGFMKSGEGQQNKGTRGKCCGHAGDILCGPSMDFYGQRP